VEQWEQRRKLSRFKARQPDGPTGETHFAADICQGHFESHGARTLQAYEARLRRLPGKER
jgi:hypothetical protein